MVTMNITTYIYMRVHSYDVWYVYIAMYNLIALSKVCYWRRLCRQSARRLSRSTSVFSVTRLFRGRQSKPHSPSRSSVARRFPRAPPLLESTPPPEFVVSRRFFSLPSRFLLEKEKKIRRKEPNEDIVEKPYILQQTTKEYNNNNILKNR